MTTSKRTTGPTSPGRATTCPPWRSAGRLGRGRERAGACARPASLPDFVPLRRSEAATLTWTNVDLAENASRSGNENRRATRTATVALGDRPTRGAQAVRRPRVRHGGRQDLHRLGRRNRPYPQEDRANLGHEGNAVHVARCQARLRKRFRGTVRRRPPRPVPWPPPQRRVRSLPEISPLARAGGRAERLGGDGDGKGRRTIERRSALSPRRELIQ